MIPITKSVYIANSIYCDNSIQSKMLKNRIISRDHNQIISPGNPPHPTHTLTHTHTRALTHTYTDTYRHTETQTHKRTQTQRHRDTHTRAKILNLSADTNPPPPPILPPVAKIQYQLQICRRAPFYRFKCEQTSDNRPV